MREAGNLKHARFASPDIEPERVRELPADHPATVDGRTLFPNMVIGADASQRMLISGHNSCKTGKSVTKGHWSGYPIYTLTLEERATCPRSCGNWQSCYGNSSHLAPRRDVKDPDFIETLKAEIMTLCRTHQKGLVIRLHILGDFFSVAYVRMWADMLDRFPQLHVFGYTARRIDADGPESRKIAAALMWMAEEHWDCFAIRTSHTEPGRQRAIVVDAPVDSPNVIMCPAQTKQAEVCGTCSLCWNPHMRDKTIAFLRHGMKTRGPATDPNEAKARIAALPEDEKARIAREYGAVFK